MKKVFLRTLVLTVFAVLINGWRYLFMTSLFNKEVVLIIGMLSLAAAVPVLLGFLFANISLRSPSPIIVVAKIILFLLNGLLIIGTTILTFYIAFEDLDILVSVPYLIAGSYTYYETIKIIREPLNSKTQGLSDDGILDDIFIDSE